MNNNEGWNTPETAPKDDNMILACFGFPWVSVAIWNPPSKQWCASMLEVDLYEGEWNDATISHEYFDELELIGWMPMPEVKVKST